MYILTLLSQSPILALTFLLGLVASVTVHEFAHAWTAYKLGDDTPYLQGRVNLNPASHLDPVGSLLFLVVGFGWGKPVIYNPMRLPLRVHELYVALAGPASNLIFAILLNAVALLSASFLPGYADILHLVAAINVALAAFNMIPIPPLDGSAIVAHFWPEYRSVMGSQLGTVILLLLIFLPTGSGSLLTAVIGPIRIFFTQVTTLFGLL